jgi:hypothetical protein
LRAAVLFCSPDIERLIVYSEGGEINGIGITKTGVDDPAPVDTVLGTPYLGGISAAGAGVEIPFKDRQVEDGGGAVS